MSKVVYWTELEESLVKNNYQKGINHLKKILPHRSESAIRNKCNKLNLYMPVNNKVVERLFFVELP